MGEALSIFENYYIKAIKMADPMLFEVSDLMRDIIKELGLPKNNNAQNT